MPAAAEPVPPPSADDDTAARLSVHAWRPALRLLAAAAQVLSAVNLLHLIAIALLGILEGYDELSPPQTALRLVAFSLLPLVLVWLLRRFTAASLHLEPARLVLELRGARLEIPRESLTAVEPWRLPLPGAGMALRLKSGRRLEHHLQTSNPAPLLAALSATLPTATPAAEHPSPRFAQARHDQRRGFWDKPAFKFGLFPLLPAGIMFRAHQYITFGGPFGEYDMFGLAAYLKTFAGYWLSFTVGLLLFASFWRILAEALAFTVTWLLPSRARGARQAAEWLCRLVYYGGFPALMAWRFLG